MKTLWWLCSAKNQPGFGSFGLETVDPKDIARGCHSPPAANRPHRGSSGSESREKNRRKAQLSRSVAPFSSKANEATPLTPQDVVYHVFAELDRVPLHNQASLPTSRQFKATTRKGSLCLLPEWISSEKPKPPRKPSSPKDRVSSP